MNNGRITYFTSQGERKYQEDRYIVQHLKGFPDGSNVLFMAVMDGHGGAEVSDFLEKHFIELFIKVAIDPKAEKHDWVEALKIGIVLLGEMTKDMRPGSTLSVVIVPDNQQRAYVAVVGDSPVVILDANGLLNLSPDHNARSNEQERLAAISRGAVYDNQYLRDPVTGDGLQMSRSLGDSTMASFLSRQPDVYSVDLGPHSFVIVASDGVLDPFHKDTPSQEKRLAEMVAKGADAKALVEDALVRKTGDNATALVYRIS